METQQVRPGLVLAVSSLAAFLAFLDVTIVNIAFPAITATYAATSLAGLSWVITSYNVVFAALLIPAGRLADLVGRRRVLLAGLVLFAVASAGCALAPSVWLLVAARVLQAGAAALITPASLALLLPAFPPERRGFAIGTWGAMGGIAAATGPALGGLLVAAFGWRSVFLVAVPLALLAAVAGARVLVESRDPRHGLPDLLGAALLGVGVALLALGIVDAEGGRWAAPGVWAPLLAGVVLLATFVLRSGRVRNPLVELSLFRLRSFSGAVAGSLVFGTAFYALLLANILFLTGPWHFGVLLAGVAVVPGPLMAAVGSTLGGRVVDRLGPRTGIVIGGLAFAAGCLVFALAIGAEPDYVRVFLPGTLLTGSGVGLVFSGLGSAAVAQLPPQRYATGSGVSNCARQIGAVLGISVLLSGLAAAGASLAAFHVSWVAMAAVGIVTACCGVVVGAVRADGTVTPLPVAAAAPGPLPVSGRPA